MKKISVFRLSLVKEHSLPYKTLPNIERTDDVADLVRDYLKETDREHFIVLFLNSNGGVIGINTVSTGTLTESVVHPREVFKGAILANASSIILAHNHPSGVPTPSEADIGVTRNLQDVGRILGIPVVDHVVVGEDTFTSFRGEGML